MDHTAVVVPRSRECMYPITYTLLDSAYRKLVCLLACDRDMAMLK